MTGGSGDFDRAFDMLLTFDLPKIEVLFSGSERQGQSLVERTGSTAILTFTGMPRCKIVEIVLHPHAP